MRRWLLALVVGFFVFVPTSRAGAQAPVYKDPKAPVEARVSDLLGRMTLEEKIDLVHGNEMETHANARLGIPSLKMTDGPIGVRWNRSTSFPAAVCWAASFDPALLDRITAALALETLAEGRDMLLGPCVNIARAPQGGRNFESYGEDPHLTSVYAATYVKGLQKRGVVSCTKHFAINDQETDRMTVDVVADERTMQEIHLPAFRAALDAGTWSFMAAYNKVNGTYAAENAPLLTDLLKNKWHFKGMVVSDWGAVHSTVPTALSGLDLEMPKGDFLGQGKLLAAVKEGKVSEALIDDKVRRILRVMFAMGIFERTSRPPTTVVNSTAHKKLALEVAHEGVVLLKNSNGALPLVTKKQWPLKIAVIGPNAAHPREGGGGSSKVIPFRAVSVLEGLRSRAKGRPIEIAYVEGMRPPGDLEPIPSSLLKPSVDAREHGLQGEYFANVNLEGAPVVTRVDKNIDFQWGNDVPAPEVPADAFSVRWTGVLIPVKSGPVELAFKDDDGARLYIDDRLVINDWRAHGSETHMARLDLKAGHPYKLRLEYFEDSGDARITFGVVPPPGPGITEAVKLAKRSDAAIVCVGWTDEFESEGIDRASLALPYRQDRLVDAVARANPRTVVVINGGGSVLMPWVDRAAAIVQAWYPGEQGGNAIADLLLGDVNFSGKLPVSFYRRTEDASSHGTWPGKGRVKYTEGIFVGYRHLDRAQVAPLFPFGHGLSYTRFELRDARLAVQSDRAGAPRVEASVELTNRGNRAGAEVVQLYVRDLVPPLPRPLQELKGFRRVELQPGESRRVTFPLDARAFAYYDVRSHGWKTHAGRYAVRIGASSRDIRAEVPVVLR